MYSGTLTGLADTDLRILLEMDTILPLIDLYRTDRYIHDLLNRGTVLNALGSRFGLQRVRSFHDLVKKYEIMLVDTTCLPLVLKLCSDYDSVSLLKVILEKYEPDLNSGVDIYMVDFCKNCIAWKSYKCLKYIGDYMIESSNLELMADTWFYYYPQQPPMFMLPMHLLRALLEDSIEQKDPYSIEILFGWDWNSIIEEDGEPLEPIQISNMLVRVLNKCLDLNLSDIFDVVLTASSTAFQEGVPVLSSDSCISLLMNATVDRDVLLEKATDDMVLTVINMADSMIDIYGPSYGSISMDVYEKLLSYLKYTSSGDVKRYLGYYMEHLVIWEDDIMYKHRRTEEITRLGVVKNVYSLERVADPSDGLFSSPMSDL